MASVVIKWVNSDPSVVASFSSLGEAQAFQEAQSSLYEAVPNVVFTIETLEALLQYHGTVSTNSLSEITW